MKINPVSLNCTNCGNFKNTKKTIAFLGSISKDSFESVNSGQVTKLRGELSTEEIKDILDKMTPENLISKTEQREVYKINGKIVKTTATPESKNFVTAENFALEKLFEDNITTTAKPLGLFDIKGDNQFYEGVRYFQIQEPINAKSIGTNPENYSTEMFKKYLSALFDLDEKGFINHNLTPENIGITPNGDIKIFNFGNFSFINDYGETLNTSKEERASISNFFNSTKKQAKDRMSLIFTKARVLFDSNQAVFLQNPKLPLASNVSVFETSVLYPYLTDKNTQNPLETFISYLKTKGEVYCPKMTAFIENFENINSQHANPEYAKKLKCDALNYQKILQKLLSKEDVDIIQAEAAMIQFKKSVKENKKPDGGEVLTAYNQLTEILNKLIASEDESIKKYASINLEYSKKTYGNLGISIFTQKEPLKTNLVEILFPKAKEISETFEPQNIEEQIKTTAKETAKMLEESLEDTIETIKQTTKSTVENVQTAKSSVVNEGVAQLKKSKAPIAIAGIIAFGGIAGVLKLIKKNKVENPTPKPNIINNSPINLTNRIVTNYNANKDTFKSFIH